MATISIEATVITCGGCLLFIYFCFLFFLFLGFLFRAPSYGDDIH